MRSGSSAVGLSTGVKRWPADQTRAVDDRPVPTVFDLAADRYHQARPRYPDALFETLFERIGRTGVLDILEIGPATGVATEQLAARGHRITAIEPGPRLVDAARRNLTDWPAVHIVEGSFETWEPPRWGSFDAVVAATSWHWLDPDVAFTRAHRHLRPGGHLAFWSATHVFPDGGDPIFRDLQEVYDDIGEGLPPDAAFPAPGELADEYDAVEASGLFTVAAIEHHDWRTEHDAESYIDLLRTFSGHITMAPWQQERLFGAIRDRLAERPDGRLHRHWGAILHVARARDPRPERVA